MNPSTDLEAEEAVQPLSTDVVSSLVENHREFLRFLERRVGSRAVAEDFLQEAFVRGIGKAVTLRGEESLTAWFYRLLRNAVIDHYRRQGSSERALTALARELEEAQEPEAELAQAICQCVKEAGRHPQARVRRGPAARGAGGRQRARLRPRGGHHPQQRGGAAAPRPQSAQEAV